MRSGRVPLSTCRWNNDFHCLNSSSTCQTQAVKLTWCSFRTLCCLGAALRSLAKREHVVDIHLLSSNDHFANEALDYGLSLFKCELVQILPQELPKGLRVLHHLLPLQRLLLGREELLEFLGDLG